jgi:hypothetical protein
MKVFLNEKCPICLEQIIDTCQVTSCGHIFCDVCFPSLSGKCPVCRKSLISNCSNDTVKLLQSFGNYQLQRKKKKKKNAR